MRARALIVGVGAVGWVTLCAPLAGGQTTGPVTVSFTTPGTSSYTVPAGICQVTVDARGAAGGSAAIELPASERAAIQARLAPATSGTAPTAPPGFVHAAADTGSGGLGGETTATIPVTPGETLIVTVGGRGQDIGSSVPDGGTPDGGSGGAGEVSGAGGGGSSDVRQGGTGLANRVVVAGGGGGAGAEFGDGDPFPIGFENGGGGGGLTGQSGAPSSPGTDVGGGGTQSAGGAGGAGAPFGPDGNGGSLGQGGAGAADVVAGAGGGGGLYGGGGGSAGEAFIFAFGSAGGGGSGFGPVSATFQTGVNSGDGSVRITSDPAHSGCVAAAVIVQPKFTG